METTIYGVGFRACLGCRVCLGFREISIMFTFMVAIASIEPCHAMLPHSF